MDRLTEYQPTEGGIPLVVPSNTDPIYGDQMQDILQRLAAYEDTGLEPEEINNLKNGKIPDHWAELFKAECEDRLVVLPCKVGDAVYVITKNKVIKTYTIGGVIIDQNNIWLDANEGIYGGGLLNSLQFGIDVFSTLEEAKKTLEGMNNG